jgi:ribose/xylose/arabinose/galactoside ABC-type transport system permease subunit
MIIVKNAKIIYAGGDTPSVGVNELSRWIQAPILWVIPPQVIIPLFLMGVMAVFLSRTPVGKSFYLLGGNAQTAWYAGLNVDRYVIGAFVLSGVLSSLGGALIAMREAAADPTMGDSALMAVVAAVIIGGTSMKGGKGSVFDSAVALVVLAALINGLNCLRAGFEIELMASGLVLASVVLYDAWSLYRREKKRGRRQDLLKELREADAAGGMSSA